MPTKKTKAKTKSHSPLAESNPIGIKMLGNDAFHQGRAEGVRESWLDSPSEGYTWREIQDLHAKAKQPAISGVNIAVPSVTKEKMVAISNLCQAVKALAHALNSVCFTATISNNVIYCPENSTGIKIQTKPEA